MVNRAMRQAQDGLYLCPIVACQNLSYYVYFLVKKSLGAFAIFWGQYRNTSYAHQMLLVMVQLHHYPFAVKQLPEPLIRMCRTSYLMQRSGWLRPRLPVVSICPASSPSAQTSPFAVVLLWRLCPSPSLVHHLGSACPALSVHHPHLAHLPNHPNLQDGSYCVR